MMSSQIILVTQSIYVKLQKVTNIFYFTVRKIDERPQFHNKNFFVFNVWIISLGISGIVCSMDPFIKIENYFCQVCNCNVLVD